ncbi:unnamed protein product [Urochloa humidicola]
MLPFPMKLLLAFDRSIHNPVETIKSALSRALAHYRPVAGRLDGNDSIACTVHQRWRRVRGSLRRLRAGRRRHGRPAGDGPHRPLRPRRVLPRRRQPLAALASDRVRQLWVRRRCHVEPPPRRWHRDRPVLACRRRARPGGVAAVGCRPVRRWDDDVNESIIGLPPSKVAAQSSTVDSGEPRCLARHDIALPRSAPQPDPPRQGRVAGARRGCDLAVPHPCGHDDVSSPWRRRPRVVTRAALVPVRRARLPASRRGYGTTATASSGGQVVPATSGAVVGSSIAELVRLIRRAKKKVPELLLLSCSGSGHEERTLVPRARMHGVPAVPG